ncbi:trypsin-like serine protease [Actinoplanes campanulatus]|uniref:trypsin-like serine protease n=1 Tax=Actinoplanes campanulatus TaxID=113559 RepID=UPI0019547AD5|nr:trypsin-like serine protease [Actinoplanes capillaceus]
MPWEMWTTGPIAWDTAWHNQPQWLYQEDTSTENSCYDTTVTADATSFFRRASTGNISHPTMGLRAADEADYSQYKQFWSRNYSDWSKVPYVEVLFTVDVTASGLSMDEGTSCVAGADRPAVDNVIPVLHAQIDDPAGQQVRADFELAKLDGTTLSVKSSTSLPSGTSFNTTVPTGTLTDAGTYKWRARGVTTSRQGPWSPWCEFVVNQLVVIVGPDEVNEEVPEALRDALGVYEALAEGNPDDFGYPTVQGSTVVVDVVTSEGVTKAEALQNGTLTAEPPTDPAQNTPEQAAVAQQGYVSGVEMDTTSVAMSRAQTEEIVNQVTDAVESNAILDAADIWKTEVDRDTGRVAVTMSDITGTAAQALATQFGNKIQLIREADPELEQSDTRNSDRSAFSGGAIIHVANNKMCTTAFSWKISPTVHGMLTAGHCVPNGGDVASWKPEYMGDVKSGSRENWQNGKGTVGLSGSKALRGDMALIELPYNNASRAGIYRGSATSTYVAPVSAMWHRTPSSGDKYCTSGAVSGQKNGEICGWTVKEHVDNLKIASGEWVRNIYYSKTKSGWCLRPGDSGGPVYTVKSDGTVVAKGIINGGSNGGGDYYAGALDPPKYRCTMYFTAIQDAYYGFPGILRTS